jgi:hypothetical protein
MVLLMSFPTAFQSEAIPSLGTLGAGNSPARNKLAELNPSKSADVKEFAFFVPLRNPLARAAKEIARDVVFVRMIPLHKPPKIDMQEVCHTP